MTDEPIRSKKHRTSGLAAPWPAYTVLMPVRARAPSLVLLLAPPPPWLAGPLAL
eukprot:COSAG01_NODE_54683_length_330_cov_1.064935_1_plen_53_part_10